jgi:hypothetical protein
LPLRLILLVALPAVIILSAYNLGGMTKPALAQYSEETAGESYAPTTYVTEEGCASVEVGEGYYLYYSPTEPYYFCVHPVTQSPWPIVGGDAQIPSTRAVAPDQRLYCSAQGELTAATLQELYAQGRLPSL